jgi:transcriptional regulator with XRE-family HTH domain
MNSNIEADIVDSTVPIIVPNIGDAEDLEWLDADRSTNRSTQLVWLPTDSYDEDTNLMTTEQRAPARQPTESFGKTLRALRRKNQMSQAELANAVRMDISYISKLENGRVPPPSEAILRGLAARLHVDTDELLVSAGKMPADLERSLATSPRALQFLREAMSATLDAAAWDDILNVLRDRVRRDVLAGFQGRAR